METNDIIQKLWQYGHFHNTDVKEAELPSLRLTDREVKIALQSYQDFFAVELDRFTAERHGRISVADGDFGPATQDLLLMERCGYPDYSIEAANGSGSWPSGCHPKWPSNHCFTIQVDKRGMPSYLKDTFEPAFALVQQAYANMGIVFLREDNNPKANTVITWQRGSGWIGLAIVPRNPKCGERIWAKFDNRYQPSQLLDQWSRLIAHELGHNMGMSHSRGGVMNPSITSGVFTKTAWRGDPSEPLLRRMFGGVPVNLTGSDPIPPISPQPPERPDGFWFNGNFVLMQGDRSLGEFILIPKTEV